MKTEQAKGKAKGIFQVIINITFNILPEIEVKIYIKSEKPLENYSGAELSNFSF